jgi:hypothetical protein
MRTGRVAIGVAGALALAATATATATGNGNGASALMRSAISFGPGPAMCEPFQAHTLASDSTAVVYSVNGAAYGCLKPAGAEHELGSMRPCIGATHAGPFALAGDDVAYGAETCGVDDSSTEVIVRSLNSGRALRRQPATSRSLVEQEGGIQSLVVKSDGSVAWIATEQSLGNRSRLLQVFKDDRRGLKLLDSGLQVLPSSLRLHGSKLTWRHEGELRSATLS